MTVHMSFCTYNPRQWNMSCKPSRTWLNRQGCMWPRWGFDVGGKCVMSFGRWLDHWSLSPLILVALTLRFTSKITFLFWLSTLSLTALPTTAHFWLKFFISWGWLYIMPHCASLDWYFFFLFCCLCCIPSDHSVYQTSELGQNAYLSKSVSIICCRIYYIKNILEWTYESILLSMKYLLYGKLSCAVSGHWKAGSQCRLGFSISDSSTFVSKCLPRFLIQGWAGPPNCDRERRDQQNNPRVKTCVLGKS